jgi:acyl carrier protein
MKRAEFYRLLDNVVEAAPGTITGTEALAEIRGWDSLAILGFMAAVDRHFGIKISAVQVTNARTVADLTQIVAQKLTD